MDSQHARTIDPLARVNSQQFLAAIRRPVWLHRKKLRAIVGIELTIDHLEGRLKVSQDEVREDRLGTVEGLIQNHDAPAQVMANMVLRELKIEEHDRTSQ